MRKLIARRRRWCSAGLLRNGNVTRVCNDSGCQARAGLRYHPPPNGVDGSELNGSFRLTDGCLGLSKVHTSKSISLDYLINTIIINNWVRHPIVRPLLKLTINKGAIPGSGGIAPSGPALR